MIGQTLGHYHILEKIGAGGMGVVYRARDERLARDVAVKVLPAGRLSDDSVRRRFRTEALALSQLNHPNIATVHDFDTQDGVDFLVMELIPGVGLSEKLGGRPLPEKEILRLGMQLAEGLTAAHAEGVVHRDLKPGNLRVTPDGRLKILDFGLARLLQPGGDVAAETLTETQAVAGTLPYMPPEQLRGERVDNRSDLYAAGAVLYEMAAGRRAFSETHGPKLVDAIFHHQPAVPGVSAGLDGIILKCLDKDPGRRYQSARELRVDLERLSQPGTTTAPATRPVSRRRVLVIAGAVAAALAVAVLLRVGGRGVGRVESLAVLPLENLSRDPQQDYFADGMTEALISDLAKIRSLRVVSRTSVMRYKGQRKPLPEIARELQVDAIVEGSVARSGDRVRISAQLIHASTDRLLWAENYERDLRDILALQGEVARAIANEIRIQLTPQEKARLTATRPVNPEAHEAYLKGRYYSNQRGGAGMQDQAIAQLRRATEIDPSYALAWAALADTYGLNSDYPNAKAAATQALQIDDTLADAHAAMATVKMNYEWDWGAAEREIRRAIEVDPRSAEAHHQYSHYWLSMGKIPESLTESRRALELEPLSNMVNEHLGQHYYYAREYDRAIDTVAGRPILPVGHLTLGKAYTEKGRFDQAVGEFEKARGGGAPSLAYAYAKIGKLDAARKILNELKARANPPSYPIALIYAGLGNRDEAFAWLDRAYRERSSFGFMTLKVEPQLDSLRADPRFADLLRRLGLPAD